MRRKEQLTLMPYSCSVYHMIIDVTESCVLIDSVGCLHMFVP
jgi:hypothetical protein